MHPDVDYVTVVGSDGDRYLLAEARVAAYARELGEEPEVVARYKGTELVGKKYLPPFDFFVGRTNAHQVLAADYVTTDDGTGIVHIAPPFGEDDKVVTDAAGIEVVVPVGPDGEFTAEVAPYEGVHGFEANKLITRDLKEAGLLLRHETYDHPYPHCWRCANPLIQRALSAWFVAVTQFKDRMVELNQQINWVPGHIKDGQFGKWLENARDWNISRNRYRGSPLPVWVSDNPEFPRTDVYGSLDELARDFGVRPDNLHRPFIDELTRPNPDDPSGKSVMRRIPAGQSSYGPLVGAGDWLVSTGGTSVVVWHREVARTVTFPVSRGVHAIDPHGVLLSSGDDGLWRGEERLEELPGRPSAVKAMSADGDVVGTSADAVAVWPAGSTTPHLLEGSDDGRTWWPQGIDADGNVVATTNVDQGMLGYVWDAQGERSVLQPLPGHDRTVPTLIEDGRVHGYSSPWSGPGEAESVEWNLSGEVVRTTDEGPVFDVNAAGDELLSWNSAVRRAGGRVDRWSYPYSMPFPSVLTDNGDLYGGAYYEGPSKLF